MSVRFRQRSSSESVWLPACYRSSWDAESRKDEMAALGADILRIVFTRIEAVAARELEREE